MKIYGITKGQLITLWVFGIIFWLFDISPALESYSQFDIPVVLLFLIPAILIFYTFGWKKHNLILKGSFKSQPKKYPVYEEILNMGENEARKFIIERKVADLESLLEEMISHEEKNPSFTKTDKEKLKPAAQAMLNVFNRKKSKELVELFNKVDKTLENYSEEPPDLIGDAIFAKFATDFVRPHKK
ncbi:MAG: hypothetical protein PHE24_06205 [Patescibacteria group bacterium]|nr:hypothetical protein [Patescibacteria group bacterium]